MSAHHRYHLPLYCLFVFTVCVNFFTGTSFLILVTASKIHWKIHWQLRRLFNPVDYLNLSYFVIFLRPALPVQIHEQIFPKSVYSRFTVQEFRTSRPTENRSNDSQTVTNHEVQKWRITRSRKHPGPPHRTLYSATYLNSNVIGMEKFPRIACK